MAAPKIWKFDDYTLPKFLEGKAEIKPVEPTEEEPNVEDMYEMHIPMPDGSVFVAKSQDYIIMDSNGNITITRSVTP